MEFTVTKPAERQPEPIEYPCLMDSNSNGIVVMVLGVNKGLFSGFVVKAGDTNFKHGKYLDDFSPMGLEPLPKGTILTMVQE